MQRKEQNGKQILKKNDTPQNKKLKVKKIRKRLILKATQTESLSSVDPREAEPAIINVKDLLVRKVPRRLHAQRETLDIIIVVISDFEFQTGNSSIKLQK